MTSALLVSIALIVAAWSSRRPPAAIVPTVLFLLLVAVITAAIPMVRRSHGVRRLRLRDLAWAPPLLLLGILLAVQALNPSHTVSTFADGLEPRVHVRWLPRSADASATWLSLAWLIAYAGVFWVARTGVRSVAARRVMFVTVLASGFAMAVWVILERLAPDASRVSRDTGAFANENSYAAFINLLLPIALALAVRLRAEAHLRGQRSHAGYLAGFAGAVLVLSVCMSASKAGMAVTAGVLVLWGMFVLPRRDADRIRRRRVALLCAAAAVAVLAALAAVALRRENMGLESLWGQLGSRLSVCRAALRMFADRPWFGIGAGAFARAFPYYQPAGLEGFYRHAHNDWIECLVELGLLGSAMLAAVVAGIAAPAVASAARAWLSGCRNEAAGVEERAMLVGLVGVGLHATVDFPLHIPAVALLASAWGGVLRQRSGRDSGRGGTRDVE